MHKKYLKFFFGRLVFVGIFALLQLVILIVFIWGMANEYIYWFLTVLSVGAVIYLVNKKGNPSYKLAWTIPILIFPVFGGLLYIMSKSQSSTRRFKAKLNKINIETQPFLNQNLNTLDEFEKCNDFHLNQSYYLLKRAKYPIYKNTSAKYLPSGEIKFVNLLEELQKAKHFIFLEYFIIQEGIMWNSILDILIDKVKQGVDVRCIYDDMGCINTLPPKYHTELEKHGIKVMVFNPFVPTITVIQNNRDHRKIVVIDGHTAFTGGVNLADEYINVYERFGHWKDASVMLKGEAVWSFTILFLQMWYLCNKCDENLYKFSPHSYHVEEFENEGFIQPYGDTPLDSENVGENVYLDIIHRANKFVYIMTPYLIIDNEIMSALTLTAKSGVDVRIITPHRADKWYVHIVTQSYYQELIEEGVKIYEYTPGFIHSKTVVADDETAVVGTINLDYRSLYLHFECATLMSHCSAVQALKADFLETLNLCTNITLDDCKNTNALKKVCSQLLRLFAPLM